MLGRLFLLFTIVTLVEMVILIQLGGLMGFWPTVALVAVTGFVGAALAKREGLRTLGRVKEQLGRGEMPTDALLDGLCILIAGAFLVTPGVLTDIAGFLLLMPPARVPLKLGLRRRFTGWLADGSARVVTIGGDTGAGASPFGPFGMGYGSGPQQVGAGAAPRRPEPVSVATGRVYRDGDVIDVTIASEPDDA